MKKSTKAYETPQAPFEYTLEEVAKTLGVSKERVRQIEYQAIRKLKRHARPLKEYVYGG